LSGDRVGLKSLIYFETVSKVALAIGFLVGEVLQLHETMAHPIELGEALEPGAT
jgi:Na+/H+-dicarboxylate symporter